LHVRSIGAIQNLPTLKLAQLYSGMTFVWKLGSGYEHAMVTIINEKGRRQKVLTYLATPDYIDDSLKPYGWYKDFVLAGGRKHDLPPEYIAEYIQSVEAIEDPNKTRDEKQRATLESVGQ
jgi:hypothetical protein